MSATIKVIYRGEELSQPDLREMYIEIDDVIHLHYRDLQLDFGRKEFEDFVRTFKQQADSLLAVIDKTDCKNAPVADFDGEEYKIWSGSTLKNNVTVNPQRVSLEECSDGYHLHYRNYNLLLDEKGFRAIKKAFATAETEVPVASTIDELLELFKLNRIRFDLLKKEGEPEASGVAHKIVMSDRNATKARAVMAGISMEGRLMVDKVVYAKSGLSIELVSEEDLAAQ